MHLPARSRRTNPTSWPVGAGRTGLTHRQPHHVEGRRTTMWEQVEFALHASLARVLIKVGVLLPAVLSLVVAVLICGLLGFLLASLVRRILVFLRFDERVSLNSSSGLLQWSPLQ